MSLHPLLCAACCCDVEDCTCPGTPEGRWELLPVAGTETLESPLLCDVPRLLAWRRRWERAALTARGGRG